MKINAHSGFRFDFYIISYTTFSIIADSSWNMSISRTSNEIWIKRRQCTNFPSLGQPAGPLRKFANKFTISPLENLEISRIMMHCRIELSRKIHPGFETVSTASWPTAEIADTCSYQNKIDIVSTGCQSGYAAHHMPCSSRFTESERDLDCTHGWFSCTANSGQYTINTSFSQLPSILISLCSNKMTSVLK